MTKTMAAMIIAGSAMASVAMAQGPTAEDLEMRNRAMATRRAERDLRRAEHGPSRPVTLRDPIPLPVVQSAPPGGEAAGRSCPSTESCSVEYAVPSGKVLVVTALWSATNVRCDGASVGSSPPAGQVIAPWWQCKNTLAFAGQGAGFSGYLFATQPKK